MKKVRFAELSEPVRTFLDQVQRGEGLVVEDERGCARYGVIPYEDATLSEQGAAWQRMEQLQKKIGLTIRDWQRMTKCERGESNPHTG